MLATARPQHVDGFAPHNMSSYLTTQGASARPSLLHLNNATPRRLPELAVRNKAPHECTAFDNSRSSEESNGDIQPAPARGWPSSSDRRAPSKSLLKHDQRHHRHDSKDSNACDFYTGARHHSKRRSSGVLGFLTLKEPSTSALDQFAEHERKKAAQKGVKSVGVMPGVSMQKLPDYVPKVNSKWDGLPESARRKSGDRERMKRSSIMSIGSAGGQSPRKPYGSISSKPSGRLSQEKKRANVSVTEIYDDRPSTSRTTYSSPPPSAIHPALRTPDEQTFLHSPGYSSDQAYPTSTEIELPELPPLQDRGYSSGTITSPDASPRTPAFDSMPMTHKTGHMQPLSVPKGFPSTMDTTGTFYLSDSDDVLVKSSGPDVLQPPTSLPSLRSARSATKVNVAEAIVEEIEAPSDKNKSRIVSQTNSAGADGSPARVRNFSHVSKYYQRSNSNNSGISSSSSAATTPPVHSPAVSAVGSVSTRPTTMQSSIAPGDRGQSVSPVRLPTSDSSTVSSGLSAQWASPSKDRLSLGPQIKKNEVLPWEKFEPPPEQPAIIKNSSKGNGKLKRLSYKLGKK